LWKTARRRIRGSVEEEAWAEGLEECAVAGSGAPLRSPGVVLVLRDRYARPDGAACGEPG
jgi:hypothetical protein